MERAKKENCCLHVFVTFTYLLAGRSALAVRVKTFPPKLEGRNVKQITRLETAERWLLLVFSLSFYRGRPKRLGRPHWR